MVDVVLPVFHHKNENSGDTREICPGFMSHTCGTFRPMIVPGKRGQYACESIITPERTEPHQPSELDSILDETT